MERRKRNPSTIVGLDVGTTKICVIVGEMTEGGATVHSVNSHPSTGLRKGVVIDLEATSHSIKEAIAAAEAQTGKSIREVFVGIAGSHIKSFNSFGAVGVRGKEVTAADVERAIDSASAVYVPLDREILHVLPTDFILDGQEGIKDPVGMAGVRLEVKVYIVTGAVTSVQNLLKCCEKAGLDVVDIILQPLASAEATLTPEEREMGVALVDIGGGTTDVAIYKDGWLRHTAVLGIGGNHFTNDLSVGLKLPFYEAERVKKQFGSLLPMDAHGAMEIEVAAIDGQRRSIRRRYISEIIQPRGEELLELINKEMQALQNSGIPVLGLVLTGGASLLAGFDRVAEALLSVPVRIGYPHCSRSPVPVNAFSRDSTPFADSSGMPGEYNNPMYATGIGLVLYGAESVGPVERPVFSSTVFNRIVSKMTEWFKNIFAKNRGGHV